MLRTLGVTATAVMLSLAATADAGQIETTQRRVQGIITAVDEASVTISPVRSRRVVTGRIDPGRTRIALDGKPAQIGDLEVPYSAKGVLGLDDVWLSISATR